MLHNQLSCCALLLKKTNPICLCYWIFYSTIVVLVGVRLFSCVSVTNVEKINKLKKHFLWLWSEQNAVHTQQVYSSKHTQREFGYDHDNSHVFKHPNATRSLKSLFCSRVHVSRCSDAVSAQLWALREVFKDFSIGAVRGAETGQDGFCTRLLVACYGRQMRLLWFLMSTCSVGSSVSKPLSCVCLIWGAGVFDGENLHIYWVVENVSARACYIHLSVVSHVSGREEQSCRVTQSFSVKIGRMNPCSLHTRAGSR